MPIDPQFAGASHPAQTEPARPLPAKKDGVSPQDNSARHDKPVRRDGVGKRDYYARLAARFLKDPLISPDAKLLRALLAAFADERSGRTLVSLRRIELLMRCGRKRRSAAQNELVAAGWLQLERERAYGGAAWAARPTASVSRPYAHRQHPARLHRAATRRQATSRPLLSHQWAVPPQWWRGPVLIHPCPTKA